MTSGMLVAGIGNIFLSDDGFGVEVVSRLAGADLPGDVRVVDYGIRGMHLAYDLASGYESAVLVDAVPRGEPPGTVYVIEPDLPPVSALAFPPDTVGATVSAAAPEGPARPADADSAVPLAGNPFFDAHGMQPDVVFGLLDQLTERRPDRILVVGCEPASVDYGMGLSAPVTAAVDEAVRIVLDLVARHAPRPPSRQPATGPGDLLAEE